MKYPLYIEKLRIEITNIDWISWV